MAKQEIEKKSLTDAELTEQIYTAQFSTVMADLDLQELDESALDRFFEEIGAEETDGSESGDGFYSMEAEERIMLVGVPFRVLDWNFSVHKDEENNRIIKRVTIRAFCPNLPEGKRKFKMRDSSDYGMRAQMDKLTRARVTKNMKHPQVALKCPEGLIKEETSQGGTRFLIAGLERG